MWQNQILHASYVYDEAVRREGTLTVSENALNVAAVSVLSLTDLAVSVSAPNGCWAFRGRDWTVHSPREERQKQRMNMCWESPLDQALCWERDYEPSL